MKKKVFLDVIIIIPFIAISLIICFRARYYPTNEEIIYDLRNAEGYTADVEYTIKNSRGDYREDVAIFYSKDFGMKIEFDENRTKIYKDESIIVRGTDDEYMIDGSFDYVYPLAFLNRSLENKISEVYRNSEEWGEREYLEIVLKLSVQNRHINYARLYVDKKEKTPIAMKIYDVDGKESITIKYKKFRYLNKIDEEVFK